MIIFCLAILFFVCVIIAEHHGPLRINCWQDPMSPSIWKEEHVSLLHFYIIFYMLNVAKIYFVKKRFILLFFASFFFWPKGVVHFLDFFAFYLQTRVLSFWSSTATSVDQDLVLFDSRFIQTSRSFYLRVHAF